MSDKPNIAELAVATWRLERWLDNLNAERKMAAKKSLREIKKYISASEIEIVDPLGWKFDPGLAIEVVNNEAEDVDESELIVIQTNSPIIKEAGSVIQYGKVILGLNIKQPKENKEIGKSSTQEEVRNEKPAESKEKYDKVYKYESYEEYPGYMPYLEVRMNERAVAANLIVYLMDKFSYKENYLKGMTPQCADGYIQKTASDILRIPYQGDWYVIISGNQPWDDQYEITVHPGILKNPEEKSTNGTEDIDNDLKIENSYEEASDTCANYDCRMEKPEIEISEKAAAKMAKKNAASYNIQLAKITGALKNSHKKKKK